jgi:DNA-binding HxlR family transcriptional regulator
VKSTRRRYRQLCTLALALDVIGDRWTMLVMRELFAGPKRFTDLLTGLPRIGTAVLSERLQMLETHGLIGRRRLTPPAPAVVYELTAHGAALDPILTGLARWGTVYLAGAGSLARRPRWLLQALAAAAGRPPVMLEEVTNFILDGEECHLLTAGDRVVARDGLRSGARLTVRGSSKDLYLLATSRATQPATLRKRFTVVGDRLSANRLLDHLAAGVRQAGSVDVP